MSELLLRVFLALAVAFPSVMGAQALSRETDSLLQRVHALDSVMLARGRIVDSVRRSVVRLVPPVDVRRDALRVRTDSTLEPRVRQAVDSVAELIAHRGGHVFGQRASAYVPMVTRDSARSMFGMVPVIAISADTARRWSMIGQRHVSARASAGELADGLTTLVEQLAMQGADSSLAAWVMMGRAPLRPTSASETADAYIELATTESIALRRCRARDMSACLDALGVDSMPGTRLARWYAPEDYRSVMRGVAPPGDDSVAVAAWIRCRKLGDVGACSTAVFAIRNDRVPLPLSASVRLIFVREVMDAGGPGAFDRLMTTRGTIRDRLSVAAKEPLDRTVERWLDRVERSRPERMRMSATLLVASLGWTTVILALALVRRTP